MTATKGKGDPAVLWAEPGDFAPEIRVDLAMPRARGRRFKPPEMMTVVSEIGDMASEAGQNMALRYGRIVEPMPLKGGTADPAAIYARLVAKFPHLADAAARIVGDLHLGALGHRQYAHIRPLLLVGPSGIGKTLFAKRLASQLNVGFGEFPAAGSSDDRVFRGTGRGWHSAQPGLPIIVMLQSECANPLFLIDEIDKAGGSEKSGSMVHTLLGLLEPATAGTWFDEALMARADLSKVSWILTANRIDHLPPYLLSRLAIVHCKRPEAAHFDRILESVLRDIARQLAIVPEDLPELHSRAIALLRHAFSHDGDIRRLRRAVEAGLGAAAAGPRLLH
ncbi:MAG: AAA family ATPase [Alphaproteobacteria bacterium]